MQEFVAKLDQTNSMQGGTKNN